MLRSDFCRYITDIHFTNAVLEGPDLPIQQICDVGLNKLKELDIKYPPPPPPTWHQFVIACQDKQPPYPSLAWQILTALPQGISNRQLGILNWRMSAPDCTDLEGTQPN